MISHSGHCLRSTVLSTLFHGHHSPWTRCTLFPAHFLLLHPPPFWHANSKSRSHSHPSSFLSPRAHTSQNLIARLSQTWAVLSQCHPRLNDHLPCLDPVSSLHSLWPPLIRSLPGQGGYSPTFPSSPHPCLKPFSASPCPGSKGKWEEVSHSLGNTKSAQEPTWTLCSHPGLCEAPVTREGALVACTVPGNPPTGQATTAL